ncbi:transcriptional regulator [Candidatus Peregrinibacteria bacterium HGW-Peregrinibacteria-1]|jgi:DNA-binding HxlR family transcriptional regulator|nr:MAG: transcriptional regulator [Candidatus Peregrinibacteria bacterium HGW-Peregrinibacteria-1]
MKNHHLPKNKADQPTKCPTQGITLFGDAHTLLIISTLDNQEKRFCELQRDLGDLNPVTLTNRLKKLEKEGFLKRHEETITRLSVSYSLTPKAQKMIPIINSIKEYSIKYL